MSGIVELARPKINLTLRILGRRPDGYHELQSLVAFAGPPERADVLALQPDVVRAQRSSSDDAGVQVGGPFAADIVGENLLTVALERVGALVPGLGPVRVELTKNLPVAAGIGGGSADAAALLRALERLFPQVSATLDWQAIAQRLGADVPVCLADTAAWMSGIGERVEPLLERNPSLASALPVEAVLINPLVSVPSDKTARVFRALAAPPLAEVPALPAMPATLADLAGLIENGNDLQRPACEVVPDIANVLDALRAMPGCAVAAMSGAGPTCFGLFADSVAAATAIAARHGSWWVRAASLG